MIAPPKLQSLAALRARDAVSFDASIATIAKGGSAGNLEAAALAKKAGVGVLDVLELATEGIELLAKNKGAQQLMKDSNTQGSAPAFGGATAGATLRLKGFGEEVTRVKDEARGVLDALRDFAPLSTSVEALPAKPNLASKVGWLMEHVGAFLMNAGDEAKRAADGKVSVQQDRFTQEEAAKLHEMIKGSDPVVLAALKPRFELHVKAIAPDRIDEGAKAPLAAIQKAFDAIPPHATEAAALLTAIGNATYDFASNLGPRREAEATLVRLDVPLPLRQEALEFLDQSFASQIRHREADNAAWAKDLLNPLNPLAMNFAGKPQD
jgi:hypothetical protein